MKMFTNINNIFNQCVDNVKKLSYNVKRVMSKIGRFVAEIPKIILFVLLFLVAMLLSVFNVDSAENLQNSACVTEIDLNLSVISVQDEHIDVAVTYNGEKDLYGVVFEMVYDTEKCKIENVRDGAGLDKSTYITYLVDGGKISLLLDSFDGIGAGDLVIIGFSLLPSAGTHIDLSISGGCGKACVMQNGVLEKAHVLSDVLSIERESGCVDGYDTVKLSLNDNGCVTISEDTDQPCVFLGFDVTVADIYGASTQNFTVSSRPCLSGDGTYTSTVDLPFETEGECVVVVRSVRYERNSAILGNENVFVIRKGEIYCINALCERE